MTLKKDSGTGIVYSTERGRMCPSCERPVAGCICSRNKPIPAGDGMVRIGRETKGRRGKGMTVVTGIPLAHPELLKLGRELKKKCGTGGTVKDGVIEIQGDHRDLLTEELSKLGWKVRRSGG